MIRITRNIIDRKIFIRLACIIAAAFPAAANAQNPRAVPPAYATGAPVNYVRTFDPGYPMLTDNNLTINYTGPDAAAVTTQYLDGLGRPLQTVVKQGSLGTAEYVIRDGVSSIEYDEYGRPQFSYLPFVANNTGGNASISDGYFKLNPFQQQAVHAAAQYPGETFFYGKTAWEENPLSRVTKTNAPGKWMQADKSVKTFYGFNTAVDAVIMWDVIADPDPTVFGEYSTAGNYAAGTLTKTIVTDEQGHRVITYTDKEGKIILKKIQLTATADNGTGSGHDGWICTYYLYDDAAQLHCVLQPEAVNEYLADSDPMHWHLMEEKSFRYAYDERGRMTMKKVPGAEPVYMVYDARDRLVMTQDGNMRPGNKWMVTKYDEQNRPAETGMLISTLNFSKHLQFASSSTSYPATSSNYELLTKLHYDDYEGTGSSATPAFDNQWNAEYLSSGFAEWEYSVTPMQCKSVKNMLTWSRSKVLGTTDKFETAELFYDDRGRVIQSVAGHEYSGATDITTTQYSFTGMPLLVIEKHNIRNSMQDLSSLVVTKMHYDVLRRLLSVDKKMGFALVNGGSMPAFKQIVKNEYDKEGKLNNKILAPAYNGNNGLEKLKYDYNIRGWLLGMNRDYAKDLSNSNYFGFDLGYEKNTGVLIGSSSYVNPLYNGNITGTTWKSKGDGEKRKYDFTYDNANRLMKADFTQYTGGTFNQTAGVNYNMKMGDGSDVNTAYDLNGNIQRMQQWGLKINSSAQIDDLAYTYDYGNKLWKVADAVTGADNGKLGDFKDGTNSGTYDYDYDANGNMKSDLNKNIGSITYNYLNLPSLIDLGAKGTIGYIYDASGNKIKKTTTELPVTANGNKTITTTTEYLGGLVYTSKTTSPANTPNDDENRLLQFAAQEEGRIRFKPAMGTAEAKLAYDYMLKDHLGNVRAVITEDAQVDKYPVASLEDAKIATEQNYYTISSGQVVAASSVTGLTSYTNDNGIGNNPSDPSFEAANSTKLYKLNGSGAQTGLGITLKVMAGDQIDIFGKSYYFQNNSSSNSSIPVTAILGGFLGGASGAAATGAHGVVDVSTINTSGGIAGINNMITNQGSQSSSSPAKPKAFINCIIFDEQFKAVDFRTSMVGSNSAVKDHHSELQAITIPKNGYMYIYCSDESPVDVFFDNLQVVHTRGQLLEETHYYPFGLVMAGISSEAAMPMKNRIKYNSIELEDELDLNSLSAKFRDLDPQVGRWWQIDPKVDEMYTWGPYVSNFDNPISYEDKNGAEPNCCGGIVKAVKNWVAGQTIIGLVNNTVNTVKAVVNGDKNAIAGLISVGATKTIEGINVFKNGTPEQKQAFITTAVLDVSTAVALAYTPLGTTKSSGLGDLTKAEVKGIQKVVDATERPIEVVGSAAKGTRRGVGTDAPIGKGAGTKSDIDYVTHPANLPYYMENQKNLPGLDAKTGVNPGVTNPYMGPGIRFEPQTKPVVIPFIKSSTD